MARRTTTSSRVGVTKTVTEEPVEAAPAAPSGKGMTFNDALVITSTVLLLAAFVTTDYILGSRFHEGFFFKP